MRQFILVAVYALGTVGIVASGGSGSGGGDSSCALAIQGIAPTTDGSGDIWVGVLSKTSEGDYHSIAHLRSDGSEKGRYDFGYAAGENLVKTVAIATDALNANKVYVGGSFENYGSDIVSGLVRLKSDGSLDSPAFTAVPIAGVESIALATDPLLLPGSLYTAGIRGVDRRFNNGQEDGTFNSTITSALAVTAAADGSGDIYAGGWFTAYDGASAKGIVRLQPDGSPAVGFSIGDGFTNSANDPDPFSQVYSLARATDGTDIYVGGGYAFYDGVPSNGLARLNANGLLDSDFAVEIAAGKVLCTNDTILGLD